MKPRSTKFLLIWGLTLLIHAFPNAGMAMGYGSGGSRPVTPPKPEKAPFAEACQNPGDLSGRPRTGLFVRGYPESDARGLRTVDLLADVVGLAGEKIDRDLTFVANLRHCLSAAGEAETCAELREFADVQIPQLLKDVRFHLALAQSPRELNSGFGQTDTSPNYRMRSIGMAKLKSWERLDQEEYATARQTLKTYQNEIIAHLLTSWGQDRYHGSYGERQAVKASLIRVRFQHFQQYRAYMAATPFLQYFTKARPTREDILAAFAEFEENARIERSLLLGYMNRLRSPGRQISDGSMDEIVGTVLQYSSYLEFALLDNPAYCGLATSLIYTQSNRALGTAIAVGLPLLAASFLMPGLVAYPLGIIASTYFLTESYRQYQIQKTRAGSTLFLAPGGDALTEARDQFSTEILLFPLSMAGGRIFGTTLRARIAGRVVVDQRLNQSAYLPARLYTIIEKFSLKR